MIEFLNGMSEGHRSFLAVVIVISTFVLIKAFFDLLSNLFDTAMEPKRLRAEAIQMDADARLLKVQHEASLIEPDVDREGTL